jgi:lon-related putative ATP-dependent protease
MAQIKAGKLLDAASLAHAVRAEELDFSSTEDLEPLEGLPGQARALEAMRLAAGIAHADFNLFVLGPAGSGRHSASHAVLAQAAGVRPAPDDWVYVNNFQHPQRPRALRLPPGRAEELRRGVEKLIDDLANDIPAIFESDDYQTRRRTIEENFSAEQDAAMNELAEKARAMGVTILRTPMGFGVARVKDGEILTPEKYRALPEDEQKATDRAVAEIEGELEEVLKRVPKRMKAQREEVERLNVALATEGVEAALKDLVNRFGGLDTTTAWLDDLRRDIIENAELFLIRADGAQAGAFPVATAKHYAKPQFQRYTVNVVVSHEGGEDGHAPVVVETLPTLANLIGRIEHVADQGALVTNFTLIRAGALHRANGGYLVLDARQLLTEVFAWDALKRCLDTHEIRIHSAGERLSLISTQSLEPDPIPLDVRVVLIGERILYYLLMAFDPDFPRLFKIEADFDDRMERSPESTLLFARMIGGIVRNERTRPADAGAVARLMTECTRAADDAERFSLNLGALSDLIREADHHAAQAGVESIRIEDINAAISAAEARRARIRELSHEAINRNTLLIDTDGARIGQINALSVLEVGALRFGKPSRVSVRTRMGAGKLVDIERETDLGGPLHSKGVMILSGYLAGQYAADAPMSLWASIVFEQSYGGVDGDSASAAELFALLSSLADLPLDQSFAVTGSVNQFGDIQAIGGVNEKIEGFFDICAARGLTGRQGVLIPAANVKHLILRPRVVEAVEAERFRIIAIASIDEGIAILTGCEAGARGADGSFPAESVNGRVEARLRSFAETRRKFGARRDGKGDGG